jgi:hypothetical protein
MVVKSPETYEEGKWNGLELPETENLAWKKSGNGQLWASSSIGNITYSWSPFQFF